MKRTILTLSLGLSVLLISCNSVQKSQAENNGKDASEKTEIINDNSDIPYIVAQHYFVKNNYNKSGVTKITTQAEFDSIIGMAATMGADGKPVPIDFDTSYVIAIIGEASNKYDITLNSLKMQEDAIVVNYSVEEGEEKSYSIKPLILLIVDKKYMGEIKEEKTRHYRR